MKTRLTTWVQRSLADEDWTDEQALEILAVEDDQVDDLLAVTFEVRRRRWGRQVKLCVLRNARSGLCPEDCRYCSQSNLSRAPIDWYPMQSVDELLDGARRAAAIGAARYCMVASGRGPSGRQMDHWEQAIGRIKQELPDLELCLCVGLLSADQADRLQRAGLDWVNHNLNTSERFYPEICTSHRYQDRLETLSHVRRAGLRCCSGGIVGMGESAADRVALAQAARRVGADSIPVNFLHPIAGTPLEDRPRLSAVEGLKVLCLFRLLNPRAEIRVAGGRELILADRQGQALYAADSLFVGGYLTTPGQDAEATRAWVRASGFEVRDVTA